MTPRVHPFPGRMTAPPIQVPYAKLHEGFLHLRSYSVENLPDRILLAFEPENVEAPDQRVPCLRIVFRKEGDLAILEKFSVLDGDEERAVDLDAAHDALKAWVDWMSD